MTRGECCSSQFVDGKLALGQTLVACSAYTVRGGVSVLGIDVVRELGPASGLGRPLRGVDPGMLASIRGRYAGAITASSVNWTLRV